MGIIWKNLMQQEVSNNEKDWIEYFHEVQRVAEKIKKAYSDKCKHFEEEMLDLNISAKEIQIFERLKLYR